MSLHGSADQYGCRPSGSAHRCGDYWPDVVSSLRFPLSTSRSLTFRRALAFAGTDTTTSGLTQVIDLLTQCPEAQEKLRAEINAARDGEDLSYDALMSLPYLDAVCRETLRLCVRQWRKCWRRELTSDLHRYPPVAFVYRQ